MAENIQKIKTRYPFGGFYLELLPEAERKELESMPEEVLLSESKITTVRPDTMLPTKPSGIAQALNDKETLVTAQPIQASPPVSRCRPGRSSAMSATLGGSREIICIWKCALMENEQMLWHILDKQIKKPQPKGIYSQTKRNFSARQGLAILYNKVVSETGKPIKCIINGGTSCAQNKEKARKRYGTCLENCSCCADFTASGRWRDCRHCHYVGRSNTQQDTGAITITPNENGALIVPTADLTENFQKVDYGGAHSLIFWRDEDGTIYTAFNACQECYARGNARYTYQDGTLRCQACGNQIDVQTMRTAAWGGCQPLAIPVSYRADTETEIIFPAKLLTYSDMMFQAWDGGDYSSTLENYAA